MLLSYTSMYFSSWTEHFFDPDFYRLFLMCSDIGMKGDGGWVLMKLA
jgi:hypothetical protein